MSDIRYLDVAAGLVFHQGKLLITQRPAGGHLAGLWEFPGGKLEPGETWEAALRRELKEELAIEVEVGGEFFRVRHSYPEKHVHLRFFWCRLVSGVPQAIGCADLAWVTAGELERYVLPEADRQLLEDLRRTPWSVFS